MAENTQYTAMEAGNAAFRKVARESMLRANIFAAECLVVLLVYAYFLMQNVTRTRFELLLIFGVVYMARLNIMARCLLPRELSTEELTVVVVWISSILASIAIGAASRGNIKNTEIWMSTTLYGLGSWLNTWSELQRKWWKTKPENKGRCYTLGLFGLSRNINYFGDVVLFGGWTLASGCWWNSWVPLIMAATFYFYHIPDKEKYLAERYKSDWPSYVATTKSFVPYVC